MREQYLVVYDKITTGKTTNLGDLHDDIFYWYDLAPCPGWSTFWCMTVGEVWDDFNIPRDKPVEKWVLEEVLYKMDELIDSILDIAGRGFQHAIFTGR